MTATTTTKLEAANEALQCFASDTHIERRHGGWYVCWTTHNGRRESRRWITRGQDWYPVWSRHWAHGGTCCIALSQLIRWLRDQPVLPLSSWRYWTGPKVALGRDDGPRVVEILRDAGYPEYTPCVLCGNRIEGGLDWWSLDGVSGPACSHRSGCRQKGGDS